VNKPRYILSRGASFGTSFVPGLTQIINGEYVKGCIIIAATIGAVALIGATGDYRTYSDTNENSSMDENTGEKYSVTLPARIAVAGFYITDAYSYIDGVVSTYELNEQKERALSEEEKRQQIERQRQQEEARIERQRQQERKKFAFTDFVDTYTKKALQAGSSILILNHKTEIPYNYGVNCYIEFINISEKRMKYIDFIVVPYNRVDDVAYSESKKTLQVTDYMQPHEYYKRSWGNVWYNSTIAYMKIVGIEVTYDDNTTQAINNSEIIEKAITLSPDEYTEYERLKRYATDF
jgi:hypothetical protein